MKFINFPFELQKKIIRLISTRELLIADDKKVTQRMLVGHHVRAIAKRSLRQLCHGHLLTSDWNVTLTISKSGVVTRTTIDVIRVLMNKSLVLFGLGITHLKGLNQQNWAGLL